MTPFHCDHTDPGPLTVWGQARKPGGRFHADFFTIFRHPVWSAVLTRCPGASVPARKQAQPPVRGVLTSGAGQLVPCVARPMRAYAVHAIRACPTFVPRTKVTHSRIRACVYRVPWQRWRGWEASQHFFEMPNPNPNPNPNPL